MRLIWALLAPWGSRGSLCRRRADPCHRSL